MSKSILVHIAKLGYRAIDRITLLEGVITSVCFDLYGCIQVSLHPGLDKDGKPRDVHWYDIARLVIISDSRVMEHPFFTEGPAADGLKGPAEKPNAPR